MIELKTLKEVAQNMLTLQKEVEIEKKQIELDRVRGLTIEMNREEILFCVEKLIECLPYAGLLK